MPVCTDKECGKTFQVQPEHVKINRARKEIQVHLGKCPGSKAKPDCANSKFNFGKKDRAKAREIAKSKGATDEELNSFALVFNPPEPSEITKISDEFVQWLITIDDQTEYDKLAAAYVKALEAIKSSYGGSDEDTDKGEE